MADIGSEVHITGSDLPLWATESTAQQMSEAIADLVDLTKRQQNDIVSQLQKNGKITEQTAKAIGSGAGLAGSLGKDLKAAGHSALDTAGGFDKLNKGPLKNFATALKKSSLGFKTGLAGIGLLGQAIGTSISVIRESTAAMRDMADAGITVTGGIRQLQASLADTGMTLAEVGEIAGKYAQVMGTNGLRAITQLTKSVNAADGGFMKYGLTTAEATEFTAEYLEQQRLAGVFGRATARREAAAVQENIERLTEYSKILNVSRKQLMETTTSMLNREDVQARFAAMDVVQRERAVAAYEHTIQSFTALGSKGEEFGTMLTDVLGNPVAEASEAFRQLSQVSPNLGRAMADAARNIEKGIPVTAEQAKSMMQLAAQNKDTLVAMSIMDNEVGALAKKLLAASLVPEQAAITEARNREAFEKARQKDSTLTYEEFKKSVASNVQTAAGLDDALNKLKATLVAEVTIAFMNLVGPDGETGIRGVIKGINMLTSNISGLSDYATKFRELFDIFGKGLAGSGIALGTLAAIVSLGPLALVSGFKLLAGTLGKTSGALVAFAAGAALGTEIYNRNAVGIQDTLASWFGNEPSTEEIRGANFGTPEEQRMRAEKRTAARASSAAAKATTSKKGAPTVTKPVATEPSMSGADIAKLDIADQQLYYTKKLVRLVESNGGLMA